MKHKILSLLMIGAVLSAALCGCSGEQSSAAATAEPTAEPTAAAAAEPTEAPTTPALETYTSADGWEIDYNPTEFACNESSDEVDFVYQGDSAGTNMVAFSYVPDQMPQEVLYDRTSSYDPEQIQRSEGNFAGADDAWARTYSIVSTEEGSGMSDTFFGIEHNGGTLVVEVLTHTSDDEAMNYAVSDAIANLVDSFRWTNHEPQQEFSYVPGTYTHESTNGTDTIILNADHTGSMAVQGKEGNLYWGSTELETGTANYEYTVEGDRLYVRLDSNSNDFTEFVKAEQ